MSAPPPEISHPRRLRQLLASLGVTPYHGWGQNFLTDATVPPAMLAAAELTTAATVLEIGPGLGILTGPLLAAGARVTAVELDRRLVGYLRQRFASVATLRLIEGDILRQSLGQLFAEPAAVTVVANLPYSVTAAVLRHLLDRPPRPHRLVVMVQREVAERLIARPPAMSLLAVSLQLFGQPQLVRQVPASAFEPVPAVASAIIAMTVAPPPLPESQLPAFFRLVAAGFGQRRKTLLNSLSAGLDQPRPLMADWLTSAGIAASRRAETLTVADWLALHHARPPAAATTAEQASPASDDAR
jgi:16S rRNA (adenine1518-N6/adenine1519-N6)-dimethyltransferase